MNASIFIPAITNPYNHLSPVSLPKSFPATRVAREDLEKVICTLAHEIRNPLANISLAIVALKQVVKKDDQQIYLDIIMRNSVRINDIIADLLASRNINEMKPETYSVRNLLEEVLTMNEDRLMLKNIAVRKSYSTQDLKIKINYSKVKIALTNIIINAIEAMPAKEGLLEITTRLMNGVCYIIIKDNGTGISKENLNSIFNPYFTNKPGGMGLGLSGTLSNLNANHIGIAVRSEVGVGTRFILLCKELL